MRRLLGEFNLPDPDTAEGWAKSVVSPQFIETLLAAPHEEAMRQIVEERANLVRSVSADDFPANRTDSRPRSRDQNQVYGASPLDAKSFVQTIT